MSHIVIVNSKCIPWTLVREDGYWSVQLGAQESHVYDEGVTNESDFIHRIKEKVGKFRITEEIERKLREEYRRFCPSLDRAETHEVTDCDS